MASQGVTIPFRRELRFEYGEVAELSPLVRRVIAHNPSAFTLYGTDTYIVGRGRVAIIDPGPDRGDHVDAVLSAVKGETVTHLIVTHTHLDHSPAVRAMQVATAAPTYGFGPHGTRHQQPRVEEGADLEFIPDHQLSDGDVVEGHGWTLEAVHTPGHTSNHLCFALREERALFSGDHVMGWSTTVVSPPDGDMRAYVESLRKLLGRPDTRMWPAHGPAIDEPAPFVQALIEHREDRERQILECLRDGIDRIPNMVERMYADVDEILHFAAARSVLAHLIYMVETGRVRCDGAPEVDARFALRDR
jgi:glyoxylase-like metal-dependent hydrolase (beta-lactamase superfamily II)